MSPYTGHLVPVVGPSGAGKDSLLRFAQSHFAHDDGYVFPRRIVTRATQAEAEDHDTLPRAEFADAVARGAFAVWWEAHGNAYGIPAAIENDLTLGRTVVFNCSRAALIAAQMLYPRITVMAITADADILVDRIVARGRETREEALQRISRQPAPLPPSLPVVRIDNSGDLTLAALAFCAAVAGLHHTATNPG